MSKKIVLLLTILCLIGCDRKNDNKQVNVRDAANNLRNAAGNYYYQVLIENPEIGLIEDVTFICDGKKCEAKALSDGTKPKYLDGKNVDRLNILGIIPTKGTVIVKNDGTYSFQGIEYNDYKCTDASLNGGGQIICN